MSSMANVFLKKKETNLYTTEIILCVGNYYSQECTYAGGVPGGHGECLFDAVGSNGEGRLYHYRTHLLPGNTLATHWQHFSKTLATHWQHISEKDAFTNTARTFCQV
jgi:hypothetical protein